MTDIKQQIATQLEAYNSLDALKIAVREWVDTSDGSLDALKTALSIHHDEGYNLSESDWQQLHEQGLMFTNDDATKEEDMRRLQRYRETGYGIPHEQVAAWLDSLDTNSELPCPE